MFDNDASPMINNGMTVKWNLNFQMEIIIINFGYC